MDQTIQALLDRPDNTGLFVAVANDDGHIDLAYNMSPANVALMLLLAADAVSAQSKALRKNGGDQ